jgi:hypothetical protein
MSDSTSSETHADDKPLGAQAPKVPEIKSEDPLMNPAVVAAMKKLEEAARIAGRQQAEDEAKKAAELAAMGEAERLKVELAERENKVQANARELEAARTDLAIANTLLHNKLTLADKGSLPYLQFQVSEMRRAEPNLSAEEATAKVIENNKFLVASVEAAVPATRTVAAPAPKTTQSAVNPEAEVVDVNKMTPAQYHEYKQKKYGI